MAEHNQNIFAAADESAVAASDTDNAPATAHDSPSRLDFDPVDLRHRRDGWTPEKQRRFIEELADCGVVREAAARVEMDERSANRLRGRPDAAAFNRAWEAAIRLGAGRLRSIAYERAVTGTVKPRFYKGERIGEEIIYDNRLLIYLLGKAGPPLADVDVQAMLDDWEGWMQAIEDGVDRPPPRPNADDQPRVWQDHDGIWWTDFPPPAGFCFVSEGKYGDDGYHRLCSDRERAAIQAMKDREEARDSTGRERYFDRLR